MRASVTMSSRTSPCSSWCAAAVRAPRQAASLLRLSTTTTSKTTTMLLLRRQSKLVVASASSPSTPSAVSVGDEDEVEELDEIPEDELLLPEEDWTVPGGANDSLTSNTALGRAVGGACDELEALAELERDAAVQAANLLKKLGYKGNLLDNPPSLPEKKKKE